jgi:hypothetical protein
VREERSIQGPTAKKITAATRRIVARIDQPVLRGIVDDTSAKNPHARKKHEHAVAIARLTTLVETWRMTA